MVGVLLAGLLLTLFAVRPAPVLGVNGKALQHSVGNSSLIGPDSCRQTPQGAWICARWDNQFSSAVPYRVSVGGLGCWHATRVGPPGDGGSAKQLSGCLTLVDYIF